jgi:Protein of unknown function (DUF3891)
VIVRDTGDAWQIVLQTDHADLSADLARAWAEQGPRHDSLLLATERHDDGWAVWEQSPMVEPETGKPVNFLDVQVPAHLAFYRACIAAVTDQDAYAGLLISMHGAGIYRQRYGHDTSLGLTHAPEVAEKVDAFVAEQEAGFAGRMAAAGVDEERRWADYELLQAYDRLSLYFCMRDVVAGEEGEVQGYRIQPLGPWHVRMEPYPFAEATTRCSLLRRLVPKRARAQDGFGRELFGLAPERVEITIER